MYEPDTLTEIRNSLHRVLNEKGSNFDRRNGQEIVRLTDALAAKRKELTKNGIWNRKNSARAITPEEVLKLFILNYFGSESPDALQRTVW